jgi:hypothetical protein
MNEEYIAPSVTPMFDVEPMGGAATAVVKKLVPAAKKAAPVVKAVVVNVIFEVASKKVGCF